MMTLLLATDAAASAADAGYLAWGIALLGLTIVLVAIEIIVPTGGLLGLLAGVAGIGSIIAFFQYNTTVGVTSIFAYLVLGPIVTIYAFKMWMNSPLADKIILGDTVGGDADHDGQKDDRSGAAADLAAARELIGAEGVTATALRPVGVVVIGGRRIDALAESGIIDANTPIEVTEIYDNQIKVRPKRS